MWPTAMHHNGASPRLHPTWPDDSLLVVYFCKPGLFSPQLVLCEARFRWLEHPFTPRMSKNPLDLPVPLIFDLAVRVTVCINNLKWGKNWSSSRQYPPSGLVRQVYHEKFHQLFPSTLTLGSRFYDPQ